MNELAAFESDLEHELHRVLDPLAAEPIPARRTSTSPIRTRTVLGGAGAAVAVKLVSGFAVAALAATAAGAATEAAITGSLNPADWGQQVRQQVQQCKDTLRPDTRGIGQCVSAFAKQHGQAESSKPKNNNGSSNGNGNANGKDKTKTNGRPGHKQTNNPGSSGTMHPGPAPVPAG